jgi:hypothetical protein
MEIQLVSRKTQKWALVNTVKNIRLNKCGMFPDKMNSHL